MSTFEAELKETVKQRVRAWVDSLSNPDEPIVGVRGRELTPQQYLAEIEGETEFGLRLIKKWLDLGLQHIRTGSVVEESPPPAGS